MLCELRADNAKGQMIGTSQRQQIRNIPQKMLLSCNTPRISNSHVFSRFSAKKLLRKKIFSIFLFFR